MSFTGVERATTALALLALLAAQTLVLFVEPPDAVLEPADAVVVLYPAGPMKDAAEQILDAGLADALVVVRWADELGRALGRCDRPQPFPVHCVAVDRAAPPSGTRAQVRAAADVARAEGYRSLVVVVPSYKVVRTRLLASRCLDGTVTVTPVADRTLTEILREWPALLQALARPGC